MKHNDLATENWKECDINTDSLCLIKERDKSGKHENIYHGNFIPQIPNQLIRRFTKKGETVFEPFMGSGTTLFECEKLGRKYIGFDINPKIVNYVREKMSASAFSNDFYIRECNSSDEKLVNENTNAALDNFSTKSVQFVLMHPPYLDIVKFTDNENDLSQINNLKEFIGKFKVICENSLRYLDKNRYFAIVVGDVYKNGEVLPLAFYCMDMMKRYFTVKIIKFRAAEPRGNVSLSNL